MDQNTQISGLKPLKTVLSYKMSSSRGFNPLVKIKTYELNFKSYKRSEGRGKKYIKYMIPTKLYIRKNRHSVKEIEFIESLLQSGNKDNIEMAKQMVYARAKQFKHGHQKHKT